MNKKIRIFLIIFSLIICFATTSYGSFGVESLTGDQSGTGSIQTAGKNIVSVISSVGIVVSVLAIAAIGIKYMIGSLEERAEYKKSLMPYLIGAVLVFGASTIAQIVYQFVK